MLRVPFLMDLNSAFHRDAHRFLRDMWPESLYLRYRAASRPIERNRTVGTTGEAHVTPELTG